jgi:DNA-binding transcriptional MerR regulator
MIAKNLVDHEELLTPAEARAELSMISEVLRKWEENGNLHPIRLTGRPGSHRRYKASEVRALNAFLLAREDTFSPAGAANAIGVNVRTVWKWEKEGKLQPVWYRKRKRFKKTDVLALRRSKPPRPDITPEIVAKMRDEEMLSWREIAQRTGMCRSSLGDRYYKLKRSED